MFIYENNKSMSKDIRASITETFGFEPICINSALVSAQNRQRLYWVGVRNEDGTYRKASIEQPADRGILLKDVLDSAIAWRDKAHAETASQHKGQSLEHHLRKGQRNLVAEPARQLTESEMGCMVRDHGDRRWNHTQRPGEEEKSRCLTANVSKGVPYNVCAEPVGETADGKSYTVTAYYSTGQNAPHTLTKHIGSMVTEPQEPQRIGTMPRERDGVQTQGQAFRIYDPAGKSVTLKGQAGDGGGKTGLYAVQEKPKREQRVYEVKDGMIEVNGKRYPIKLRDGRYVIRKLTVTECMRLQTVPEWYDFSCVSNTQAYKMLGNGWTVEVIAHLIRGAIKSSILGI